MTQWKDKQRSHWLYQFKHKGVRHTGRGFNSRDEAREEEVKHRKRLKDQNRETASTHQMEGMGFREVAYEYLDEAKRDFVKKTYDFKAMVCKLFLKSLGGDMPIDEITPVHVKEYLKTRPSNNNWNAHRKDLHTVFEYAKDTKYITVNPVAEVKKRSHTPARKKPLTPKIVAAMIDACDPVEERPLFTAVLHSLGRIDELLRLTWDDVDFERRQLTLWTRKRKDGALEVDAMPMNAELYKVMRYLYETRTQTRWVFLNPKTGTRYNRRPKMMPSLCKRVFAPDCKSLPEYRKKKLGPIYGFHQLRHFMASFLAAKGKGSLKDFQRLLRHKEARTTEIYLHTLSDNLRSVVADAEVFKVDVPSGCTFDE